MTTIEADHAAISSGQRLDGKVALVTGAAGELGHRVAVALGGLGASVALNYRERDDSLADTTASLNEVEAAHVAIRADLSSSEAVGSLFEQVAGRFGQLDVVVHTPGRVTKTRFDQISDEEFEASIDQNLRAAFYVLREAARQVNDGGRIVTLTTSITGVTIPLYSIYAGHKAATEHYVRGLAKELGPRGVTVNAVGPGPINSPSTSVSKPSNRFKPPAE